MMRFRRRLGGGAAPLVLPIAMLLACSAQVEPDYQGEPIATMRGVVATSAALDSAPEVDAAIVWVYADSTPRVLGERIDVTGEFPASFTLNLYGPPPPVAEFTSSEDECYLPPDYEIGGSVLEGDAPCPGVLVPSGTGRGLWVGYLAAIRADAPDGEIDRSDIVGIDIDHVLVYQTHASDEPLPPMPTPAEIATHAELSTFGNPGSQNAPGYTLLKKNPEFQAIDEADSICTWQEGCVEWELPEEAPWDFTREMAEWQLARCLQHFPDNPVCRTRLFPSYPEWNGYEPEDAASVQCRQRYDQTSLACSSDNPEVLYFVEQSADGLDDPITIQLGLGIWDATQR